MSPSQIAIIRAAACPRCKAVVGESCRTASGKNHNERAAIARGEAIDEDADYTIKDLEAYARGEYTEAQAMAATKRLARLLLAVRLNARRKRA